MPSKDLHARAKQQVVSVGEKDLRARFLERPGQLRLDRRMRADRHEERRLHFVVQSAEGRGASARTGGQGLQAKIQSGGAHPEAPL